MSGGSQTTQGQPAAFASPYLQANAATGSTLANEPGTSMVAPMTSLQNQGISDISNTAAGSNPSQSAAAANQFETSGALLNPSSNPYLAGTFNQAANQVQSQLSSEFAGAGSNVINSLPVQSDEMNNLATQLYGGQYDTGLNTMTQASALAPSIQTGTYIPGQEEYQAGTSQQTQNQNVINAPYNALSWYSGLLGQSASPFQGSTTTQTSNPVTTGLGAASVLGGLLGGSGGSSSLSSLGGGISGLLSGLFGSSTINGSAAQTGSLGGYISPDQTSDLTGSNSPVPTDLGGLTNTGDLNLNLDDM